MHELAVTKHILSTVLKVRQARGFSRVLAVTLEIGALRGIEEAWIQRYFDRISGGTAAEGAKIHVKTIPAVLICQGCGHSVPGDVYQKQVSCCPKCGGDTFRIHTGNEFLITSMEAV